MKNAIQNYSMYMLIGLGLMVLLAGCDNEDEPGSSPDSGRGIQSEFEAREAFEVILAMATAVDEQVETDFAEGLSLTGGVGQVQVMGKKTASRVSSANSSTSTSNTDLNLTFEGFQAEEGEAMLQGVLRFFQAKISRFACSGSSCASSSTDSQAIEAENITVTFQSEDGAWITDELFIEAGSPGHTSRWTKINIKTKGGIVL